MFVSAHGRGLYWAMSHETPFPYRLPLASVLSLNAFLPAAGPALPSLLDLPQRRLVTSGRIAIAMALRAMGVGPGHEVLAPAYHSRSMIPPILWLGAAPVFFRVRPDTSVDLDDLAGRIGPATRAVMVTHYFGIPQDLRALRALCDRHGLQLLEDCAHCLFGAQGGQPVGASGDYAAGSLMKFLPLYEGGCLVSARHALAGPTPRGGGAGFEAKAALAVLEASFASGRLPWLRALLRLPLGLKDRIWNRVKRADAPALAPPSSDSSYDFDPAWIDVRAARFSRMLTALLPRTRVVARRRAHYLHYQQHLSGLPGCRPLYPALPDGACPWVFPLLVDDPEPMFARLAAAGVPMTRFGDTLWDGVDASVCPTSAHLSRHVLSFPCHDALRPDELAWIVKQVAGSLA